MLERGWFGRYLAAMGTRPRAGRLFLYPLALLVLVASGHSVAAKGGGTPAEIKAQFAKMRTEAEEGDCSMQVHLGIAYLNGGGVVKDEAEAAKWFSMAAEQGDRQSQAWLARLYEAGSGVKKSNAEAAKWWRKAAEQDDPDARTNLGRCT